MIMNFSETPAQKPWLSWYVAILIVLLTLTGLFDVFHPDDILPEHAFNLHHIWAVLGLSIFFIHGKIVMPPWHFALFFAAALMISLLADIRFGFNSTLVNVVYCFYLLLLGLMLARILPPEALTQALARAAIIIFAVITLKDLFFIDRILDTLSILQDRVFIPTVVAGGTNVEATFAVFAAAMLRGRRLYWPAFCYALFLSFLYSSRAGLLAAAILFIFEFLTAQKAQRNLLLKQIRFAVLILVAAGAVITFVATPLAQFTLDRFQDIGYEPGSEGRLLMWQSAPQVFIDHPFGVGAGNAIGQVQGLIGTQLVEGNMHNIFLQILLDLGIFGFAVYVLMWFKTWRHALSLRSAQAPSYGSEKWAHPLWLVLAIYFLLGFLQFRAYDPFAFLCLGLVWHANKRDQTT
jgi:O-antigen ligase